MVNLIVLVTVVFTILVTIYLGSKMLTMRKEEKNTSGSRKSFYDVNQLSLFWFLVGRVEMYMIGISFIISGTIIAGIFGGPKWAILIPLLAVLLILLIMILIKSCGAEVVQPEVHFRKIFGRVDSAFLPGPYLYIPKIHTFEVANMTPVIVKEITGVFSTKGDIQVRIVVDVNHQLGMVFENPSPDISMELINRTRAIKYTEAKDQRDMIATQKALDIARDFIGEFEFDELTADKHKYIRMLTARMKILFNEEISVGQDLETLKQSVENLLIDAEWDKTKKTREELDRILQSNESFAEQTGCLATSITVRDIEPASEELLTAKQKVLIAEAETKAVDAEVVKINKLAVGNAEAAVTTATANAQVITLEGDAIADAVSKKQSVITDEMLRRKNAGYGEWGLGAAEIGHGLAAMAAEKAREFVNK